MKAYSSFNSFVKKKKGAIQAKSKSQQAYILIGDYTYKSMVIFNTKNIQYSCYAQILKF